jgi:hypothetical protein
MKDGVFVENQPESAYEDYTTERNKPIPNIIHGAIQSQITYLLKSSYAEQFIFIGELSLDTKPGSTPTSAFTQKENWT